MKGAALQLALASAISTLAPTAIGDEPMPPGGGPGSPRVDTAYVHLDTPHVTLESSPWESHEWSFACAAPCDRDLQVALDYRVLGAARDPSAAFSLRAAPGQRETIVATQRPRWMRSTGISLVVVGTINLAVGFIVAYAGAVRGATATIVTGLVLEAGGLPLMIPGALLWRDGDRPAVTQFTPEPDARDVQRQLGARPRWVAPLFSTRF